MELTDPNKAVLRKLITGALKRAGHDADKDPVLLAEMEGLIHRLITATSQAVEELVPKAILLLLDTPPK